LTGGEAEEGAGGGEDLGGGEEVVTGGRLGACCGCGLGWGDVCCGCGLGWGDDVWIGALLVSFGLSFFSFLPGPNPHTVQNL